MKRILTAVALATFIALKLYMFVLPNLSKPNFDTHFYSPVLELHKQLVDIPSVPLNESHVTRFLQQYLSFRGYNVDFIGSRQNVYAYKGGRKDAEVLLTSNVDHVMDDIAYHVIDDRIYGSGSSNPKACVAAQITALEELIRDREVLYNSVGLLFVVGGEKYGSGGMIEVDKTLKPWKSVIFGKPSGLKLVKRHCGAVVVGLEAENDVLKEVVQAFRDSPFSGTVTVGFITDQKARVEVRFIGEEENVTDEVIQVLGRFRDVFFTYESYSPQNFDYNVPGYESTVSYISSDSGFLHGEFDRFLYGPGNMSLVSSEEEYVSVESLHNAVKGYKELVLFALRDKTGRR